MPKQTKKKTTDSDLKLPPELLRTLRTLSLTEQEKLVNDLKYLLEYGTKDDIDKRCKYDVREFGRIFFRHMMVDEKTGKEFPPAEFHDELYQLSQAVVLKEEPFKDKRGLAAAAPRGSGKSSLISLIVIVWALVYGHKKFIVIFSDTDDQAEKIGVNIRREFEENDILRFYFGDMCGFELGLKWTLKDFSIVRRDEKGKVLGIGRVMTRGTGSSVRGIRDRAQRPDLVVGDDLENDEHVESLEMREWLHKVWWQRAVLPMLDPVYGNLIIVGTILHLNSLLSRLLETPEFYETRKWTCFTDSGESYWPERFPLELLRQIQREDPIAFAQEYLNDPRETGARAFLPEDVRFYSSSDVRREADGSWYWRGQLLDVYIGVDPAISEEEKACDFACITIGVTRDKKNIIILRSRLLHIGFPQQVQLIKSEAKFFDAISVGIETAAYQRALAQQIRHELRDEINIKELKHGSGKVSKEKRIMSLSPLVAQGRIWFRQALEHEQGSADELGRVVVHHEQYKLYRQLVDYPSSTLDDGADGLSSAVETAGRLPFFSQGSFSQATPQPEPRGFAALARNGALHNAAR